jgi:hypothetical protein
VLTIEADPSRWNERIYICDTVFREFLGIDVRLIARPGTTWRICCPSVNGQAIEMPDGFFAQADAHWLRAESLPKLPAPAVRWRDGTFPGLFGAAVAQQAAHSIPLDVPGIAFFLLTRYEEHIIADRDRFERFPAAQSTLSRCSSLADPLVDRLVDALWEEMQQAWPGLTRSAATYRVRLTHDVDALRNRGRPLRGMLLALGADVLRRRDLRLAYGRMRSWVSAPSDQLHPHDPFNTFDFLMESAERKGLQSHFYFVPRSFGPLDPDYSVSDADVVALLRLIAQRGHGIGIHASFDSAWHAGRLREEVVLLRQALAAAGVGQSELGGRHHYLRWRPDRSWRYWEEAGLAYDSSVGFAETPGFRCGTCREFPVWDVTTARRLRLRERPLIAMDSTLFGYQHLSNQAAIDTVSTLAEACRRHRGTLVILWHNHNLPTASSRQVFRDVLDVACAA